MRSAALALAIGALNLYVLHFRLGVGIVPTTVVGMLIAAFFGWSHRKADRLARERVQDEKE